MFEETDQVCMLMTGVFINAVAGKVRGTYLNLCVLNVSECEKIRVLRSHLAWKTVGTVKASGTR